MCQSSPRAVVLQGNLLGTRYDHEVNTAPLGGTTEADNLVLQARMTVSRLSPGETETQQRLTDPSVTPGETSAHPVHHTVLRKLFRWYLTPEPDYQINNGNLCLKGPAALG